jgi:hypothetical protein
LVAGAAEYEKTPWAGVLSRKLAEREGIRTPDTVTRIPHLARRLKPLGHLSCCYLWIRNGYGSVKINKVRQKVVTEPMAHCGVVGGKC